MRERPQRAVVLPQAYTKPHDGARSTRRKIELGQISVTGAKLHELYEVGVLIRMRGKLANLNDDLEAFPPSSRHPEP